MKFWYKFLFLSVFVLAFTGCGKDDDEENEEVTNPDGKVTQLLKHKVGKGIPIVILGEGYVEKDIKGGVFREATSKAVDALFSVYPMSALKDYFDVYEVTAVSNNDYVTVWTNLAETGIYTSNTAFGVDVAAEQQPDVWGSCLTRGDEKKVVEYAKKAIAGDRINDATIFVLVNDVFTEAFSYSLDGYDASPRDIPTGGAIVYVTTMNITHTYDLPDYELSETFKAMLVCEFGHSFAKLSYENYGGGNERIPSSEISAIKHYQSYGYYSNVSLSSDVTKSPWADFAADSRYDFEKLGCYEGSGYYSKGAYRATYESAMCGWGNCFNAAQRSMIYKRCMSIANGDSWKFNYEDFVKFDLEGAKAWKAAHPTTVYSKAKALSARKTKTVKVSR